MFGKLLVRNIPVAILEGLETLAGRHDRSTEAEARYAIRAHVEPFIMANERSARLVELSERLRSLLAQVNAVIYRSSFKPSHIAEAIGEAHAGPVEEWFTGENEPTFMQLETIADYLGCNKNWLKHGEGSVFPFKSERLPENAADAVCWLLDLNKPEKVSYLHLVREADETGALVIVKQYGDWYCESYLTTMHVSEVIGNGGETALSCFAVALELLFKYYAKAGGDVVIKSYLLPPADFSKLCSGQAHPLALIRGAAKEAPWWEDFWDVAQFQKQNYWSGWKAICGRIANVIELTPQLKKERDQIRSGDHLFLNSNLPAEHLEK